MKISLFLSVEHYQLHIQANKRRSEENKISERTPQHREHKRNGIQGFRNAPCRHRG